MASQGGGRGHRSPSARPRCGGGTAPQTWLEIVCVFLPGAHLVLNLVGDHRDAVVARSSSGARDHADRGLEGGANDGERGDNEDTEHGL